MQHFGLYLKEIGLFSDTSTDSCIMLPKTVPTHWE